MAAGLHSFRESIFRHGAFWLDSRFDGTTPMNCKIYASGIENLKATGCLEGAGVAQVISNSEYTGLSRLIIQQTAFEERSIPVVGTYNDWVSVSGQLNEPYGVRRSEESGVSAIEARMVPRLGVASIQVTPLFHLMQTSIEERFSRSLLSPFRGQKTDLSTTEGLASWAATVSYNLGRAGVDLKRGSGFSFGMDCVVKIIMEHAIEQGVRSVCGRPFSSLEAVLARQFLLGHLSANLENLSVSWRHESKEFMRAVDNALSKKDVGSFIVAGAVASAAYDLLAGRREPRGSDPVLAVKRVRSLAVEHELEIAGIDAASIKSPRDVIKSLGL